MHHEWTMLLSNIALIAIFVMIWTSSEDLVRRRLGELAPVASGVLGGLTSLSLMSFAFELQQGVFIDLRVVPVALAAFFGGPFSAIVSAFIVALYRISEGGIGVGAGVLQVVLSAAAGVGLVSAFSRRDLDFLRLLVLSAAAAISVFLSAFMLPPDMWQAAFNDVALPHSGFVFVATFAAGQIMLQELSRKEASRRNEIYRAVIEALPDCLNVKDREGRFLAANPATALLMGAGSADELVGLTDFDFYPTEAANLFRVDEEAAYAAGTATTIEQHLVREDGTSLWLSTLKTPFRNGSGAVVGMITHNRDITRQKETELKLAESQNRLQDALSNMADGLVMFDRKERLLFCNDQYRRMFPKTADMRVPGALFEDILQCSLARGEQSKLTDGRKGQPATISSLLSPGTREIGLWDGRWLEARTRHVREGSLIVFSDITETKRAEELLRELNGRLSEAARTDALTGLANRRAFNENLMAEFGRARRHSASLGLLLIDLDRFKQYNDTYGHPAGDECLRKVSACLKSVCKRATDIAARYGGEELAVILPDVTETGVMQFAEAFRAAVIALQIPHSATDSGFVSVSIGVASFVPPRPTRNAGPDRNADPDQNAGPERRVRPDELVLAADKALYRAKAGGRNRVELATGFQEEEEDTAAVA